MFETALYKKFGVTCSPAEFTQQTERTKHSSMTNNNERELGI